MKRLTFLIPIFALFILCSCGTTRSSADHSFRQVRHKGTCMFKDHAQNRAKRQKQLSKTKTMPQRQTNKKSVAGR